MNTTKKKIGLFLVCLAIIAGAFIKVNETHASNNDNNNKTTETTSIAPRATEVTGLTLDHSVYYARVPQTFMLTATVLPEDATNKDVIFKSDNEFLSVSITGENTKSIFVMPAAQADENGLIGTITVTTVDGNYSATCKVYLNVAVTGIQFEQPSYTFEPEENVQVYANIAPVNATNQTVSASSDSSNVIVNNGGITSVNGRVSVPISIADLDSLVIGADNLIGKVTLTTADGNYTTEANIYLNVPVESVSLNTEQKIVEPDDTFKLDATVLPSNATNKDITFSSDSTDLSVDNDGNVVVSANPTASGNDNLIGTITVTTADGSKTATCKVYLNVPVEGVSLSETSKLIAANSTFTLDATVSPSNATNKDVTFSSDSTDLSVDNDGNVVVSANPSIGADNLIGTITVRTVNGVYAATCKVYLNVPVESVSLNDTEKTVEANDTFKLDATVLPSNATNKDVTYSSDSTDLSVDSDGNVVVSANPTIGADNLIGIITVSTNNNKMATCKVYLNVPVESVSLSETSKLVNAGDVFTLDATVSPNNATNKDVTYTSTGSLNVSNNGTVVVSANPSIGADNLIGVVSVTTADGNKTAECKVYLNVIVESISLNDTEKIVEANDTFKLDATVSPSNATNKDVTFSSDSTDLSVDNDGNVVVSANPSIGADNLIGTITATTSNNKTATCKVYLNVPVESVSLSETSKLIAANSTFTLDATVSPSNATNKDVTYSSDSTDLSVDNDGTVVVSANPSIGADNLIGTITVTTIDGNKTAECKVYLNVPVESVSLNDTEKIVDENETFKLEATVLPSNATNKDVTFSSNSTFLSVDSDGNVVVAANPTLGVDNLIGIITVSTNNNKTATCKVYLNVPVQSVSLSETTKLVNAGDVFTLDATVSPGHATNKDVTYTSTGSLSVSNNGTVVVSANPTIGADNLIGVVTVTTADGNKTAECKVYLNVPVESVSLNAEQKLVEANDTFTLEATVLPSNATNKDVTFSSDSTDLSVDNDGNVVVSANPSIGADNLIGTITVTTADGNKTAECKVYLGVPVTGVTLDSSEKLVKANDTFTLNATVSPSNATNRDVTYSSDSPDLSVSQNGDVSVGANPTIGADNLIGTITVKTQDGGFESTCKVYLEVSVESVKLTPSKKLVNPSQEFVLTTNVSPSNATNKNVSYSSDNSNLIVSPTGEVKVIDNPVVGNNNLLGTITVTSQDGNKTAECKVYLKVNVMNLEFTNSKLQLKVGETKTIKLKVSPKNVNILDIKYVVSNKGIFKYTVKSQPDANGLIDIEIKGLKAGSSNLEASQAQDLTRAIIKTNIPIKVIPAKADGGGNGSGNGNGTGSGSNGSGIDGSNDIPKGGTSDLLAVIAIAVVGISSGVIYRRRTN